MAKGQKRISVNAFERVAKQNVLPIVTKQWFGNELVIKPTLSLTEMLQFVNDVVTSCFNDQGDYMPEILDFAMGNNILEKYANFTLPKSLESRYEMIYNTDAVDTVCSNINQEQFKDIYSAIKRKIEYQCDSNSNFIRTSFEKILNSIGAIQEKADTIFDGVESDDVERLVQTLGNTDELSANKIVEAYLSQTHQESTNGDE